jgi:hypothetical protein
VSLSQVKAWTQLLKDIVADQASSQQVMVDILNEPDSRGLKYASQLLESSSTENSLFLLAWLCRAFIIGYNFIGVGGQAADCCGAQTSDVLC